MKTIIDILSHFIPLSNKIVFFNSFDGMYNDNPKYISEQLYIIDPTIKQVWYISDKCTETVFPNYIYIIREKNIKYYYFLNRAKIIIENGIGMYYAFIERNKLYKYKLLKKNKQIDIATWHGTPLKLIGYDTLWDKNKYLFSTADYLIAGSFYEKKIFTSAFRNQIPIQMMGNPRNDLLYCHDSNRLDMIKEKLGLSKKDKIVLFAPTFRDHIYHSNLKKKYDYMMNIDYERVILTLEKKFGGKWQFVFRGHQFIKNEISKKEFLSKIVDGNRCDDMAEYLAVCDVLITDFSGSLFDVAHTTKPCFLYAPDKDSYIYYTHGIYGDIDNLPYSMCKNNIELESAILNFNRDKYDEKIHQFVIDNGYILNGNSSKRVSSFVYELLK